MLKKKFVPALLTLAVAGVTSLTGFSHLPSAVAAPSGKIKPFSDETDGGSFTLMNETRKVYDNSYDYSAIYGSLGTLISGLVLPSALGWQVAGGGATSVGATWINNKLGIRNTVYVKVRVGISFNTYYNYYEYVESVTHYNDGSFSTPIDTWYGQTGVRVPDDILARYGLKNPR
ncbi:hypothetical protein [Paenibacillus ehimensis]|uniref:Uncharacterized protein n=1 Tax=Paenibacillus ehimensis TaxID=79264 RepID=A0ABT8VGP7_9BACL|nr:hypothetical protein [Paenibacillus ehimensis]MDO3680135.1 hypothetical protein [Paenibacillus ehimensis]MEC0207797.1 hypothetical protein [Paenibacillus ehimensis]